MEEANETAQLGFSDRAKPSSPMPRRSKRILREGSRSTSCSMPSMTAGLRRARQKASALDVENNLQSRGFMNSAAARHCLRPSARRTILRALTAMSFVIVPQVDEDVSSVARHAPAPGDATSANQTYGGPPRCPRDLACDPSIRPNQRKLAVERLFRSDEDAQGRACPRRRRRRYNRDLSRFLAGRNLEPGRLRREKERQKRRLRQARMQRIGALKTFVTLSWTALDGFLRRGRFAGYGAGGNRRGPDARLSHSGPLLAAHSLKEMGQNGDIRPPRSRCSARPVEWPAQGAKARQT